jgi:hypothetical protein
MENREWEVQKPSKEDFFAFAILHSLFSIPGL